jgi:hypothetical protein
LVRVTSRRRQLVINSTLEGDNSNVVIAEFNVYTPVVTGSANPFVQTGTVVSTDRIRNHER